VIDMDSTAVDANGSTVPAGERVNVEMKLQLGTLVFGSNVPIRDACVTGGYSWLNYVSYSSGLAISTSGSLGSGGAGALRVSEYAAASIIVGLTVIQLPDGSVRAITTLADATLITRQIPIDSPAPVGKRVSWREIVQ
jgi:type IV pilus assembly protein PilY1